MRALCNQRMPSPTRGEASTPADAMEIKPGLSRATGLSSAKHQQRILRAVGRNRSGDLASVANPLETLGDPSLS